ncbi:MAG: ATP-binding protein, partial [Desulfotomaculaceae bacterium]
QLEFELWDIPYIDLDEKEIRQLILNLVRNGFEAMPSGGTLTIKTFRDSGEVVLAVKDGGKGIGPEILEKIGTPFFTTKDTGTGLGLAVCYSIAARHNARIEIETGPKGTNFYVRFKI